MDDLDQILYTPSVDEIAAEIEAERLRMSPIELSALQRDILNHELPRILRDYHAELGGCDG